MRSLIIALGILASSVSAGASRDIGPTRIPLHGQAGRALSIDGEIDGQRGIFLFDSGWGVSSVTPGMAARIGCKPWGRITGFRAIGERIDEKQCQSASLTLGPRTFPLPTVSLVDIARLMPSGSPDYAGAIGLDAFAGKTVTIRERAREIVVEDRGSLSKRLRDAVPIPIRLAREATGASLVAYVGIRTGSGMLWMELDTGNNGGTMIARHAAALLGLDPDPARAHGQSLTMPVADGVAFQGPVQVLDLILDGDLGVDFLRHWDLTLDLAAGKGWLEPADD